MKKTVWRDAAFCFIITLVFAVIFDVLATGILNMLRAIIPQKMDGDIGPVVQFSLICWFLYSGFLFALEYKRGYNENRSEPFVFWDVAKKKLAALCFGLLTLLFMYVFWMWEGILGDVFAAFLIVLTWMPLLFGLLFALGMPCVFVMAGHTAGRKRYEKMVTQRHKRAIENEWENR